MAGGNSGPRARRHVVIVNWRDARHPQAGGAELYCSSVAKHLMEHGDTVTMVTSRPKGAPAREIVDGVRVVRVGGTYGVYPRALLWLWRNREQFDGVIDSQNGIPFFTPLVMKRGTAVLCLIYHVHQRQFDQYFPWPMNRIGQWLEGPVSRMVYGRRTIVAISPSTRTDVRSDLGLRGTIHVVPCGMDVPEIDLKAVRAARSAEAHIAIVGRLVPHKRLNLLIDAMPELLESYPRLVVDIMGVGPERESLEVQSRALSVTDSIRFHGRVSDAERDRLLAGAWLTVNPSAGEGWGLSVIEANTHGLPAVAFRVPGLRDAVVDGKTGWLSDPQAPLASAVSLAIGELSDPVAAFAWSIRARAWSEGFTWPRTASRMDVILSYETDRLQRYGRRSQRRVDPDRRRDTDLACRVAMEAVPEAVQALAHLCRRTDVWTVVDGEVIALLRDSDERGVRRALDRVGLTGHASIRPARPSDWLLAGASPWDELPQTA